MAYTNMFNFSFQEEKSSHSFYGKDASPFHRQKDLAQENSLLSAMIN